MMKMCPKLSFHLTFSVSGTDLKHSVYDSLSELLKLYKTQNRQRFVKPSGGVQTNMRGSKTCSEDFFKKTEDSYEAKVWAHKFI